MNHFLSIKELLNTLNRGGKLLMEMFEKRKTLPYRYGLALELLEDNEDIIQLLINKGVIHENGDYLEMDDQFLQFFEEILEVNEEINTSYINENIEQVKHNINYYLQESSESRKYTYLKGVTTTLRKIGRITIRNIVDLKRNVENTFKTEPNYRIKLSKLNNHKKKLSDIVKLIEQTEKLVTEEEQTFFKTALDEGLRSTISELRLQLNESRHNIIETQKQIVEFINQIKYQSELTEKLRQVKYLKDQFEIRAKTNINEVLSGDTALIYETKTTSPLKPSLDNLQQDDAYQLILKVNGRIQAKAKPNLEVAGTISDTYLESETEEEIYINLDEVKSGFIASGNHLFNFIQQYQFPKPVSFEERVTIYCQIISIHQEQLHVTEQYGQHGLIEYAMVYPK